MKQVTTPTPRVSIFVEALEPRIAPAGLLNEAKFTPITLGTPQLLDATGGFQGISTGSGPNGEYLLYITSGKALVFTSDLAGNGVYEPGDITGIAAGVDSNGNPLNLILFTDVHGDIVTDLEPGLGNSQLSSSTGSAAHPDGRVLLPDGIGSITLRTLTAADLDSTVPGDTVANRLALTSFSIYGNIYSGGNFGGLTIDTSGESNLAAKFAGTSGDELFNSTVVPTIGDIYTGSAASNQPFHFTQLAGTAAIQGTLEPFVPAAGAHGGDISNIQAANTSTVFNIGTLEAGNGGNGARGGDISNITLHVDGGGYQLIAGDGGEGTVGAVGGSIVNFQDLGSETGEVLLHSGSGGEGLLGVGGAGGTVTTGTVFTQAGVDIILGHGGNGFTGGGAGAGLPSATFTVPEGAIPLGSQFAGTYHAIGDVGNTFQLADGTYSPQVIDFIQGHPALPGNGDGDAVYSTTNPDQVVVVFGDGAGDLIDNTGNPNSSIPSETVRLTVPGPVTSFVVGDFNGDGLPDIAVASAAPGNAGGIYVFLDQIGNPVLDPLGAANFTHNPLGAHPFSTPLQSALPTYTQDGFYAGSGGVLALAVGDFGGGGPNGTSPDGIADIAYVQQVNLIDPPAGNPLYEAVGVLFGSAVRNPLTGAVLTNPTTGHQEGSGFFYANPALQNQGSQLEVDFFHTTAVPVLQATSLTSTNVPLGSRTGIPTTAEVLIYGQQGADGNTGSGNNALFLLDPSQHFAPMPINLGQVDTNRTPGGTNVSLTDVNLQNITISDINGDGDADITVLAKAPSGFLVTLGGNGLGTFAIQSGSGDQAGLDVGTTGTALVAIDLDANGNSTGNFSTVEVLQFGATSTFVANYSVGGVGAFVTQPTSNSALTQIGLAGIDVGAGDQTFTGLDAFYPQVESAANPHPGPGVGTFTPNTTVAGDSFLVLYSSFLALPLDVYETNNGFRVFSGDGGNGMVGAGGDAGVIGSGLLAANALGVPAGSVSLVLPAALTYEGNSFFLGGHGGNGFAGGGAGGDISGLSVQYSSMVMVKSDTTQLSAGDAGNGISGSGGRGGSLSNFSVDGGIFFSAGNGGTGYAGGAGGSVTGNQTGSFDTSTTFVTVRAGVGGTGANAGGAGGNVTSFVSQFPPLVGGNPGNEDILNLTYISGAGGSAAGGVAGSGGSITNSSPDPTENNLSGDINLITGAGGSGLIGGAGGALTNFVNSPTGSSIPTGLNVIAGNGGIGVVGDGGAGGTITNLQADATGLSSGLVRVLGGEGGASYGGTAGAGGSITNSIIAATSVPVAVAAGAGGDALLVGGAGGSVTNSLISSAAQAFGKMLVIAGDGGDATAVLRGNVNIPGDNHTNDLAHALLAFGGASALGGSGGDITGITQPTGAETAVDLIAGNGGSTLNAGTALQPTTGVGQGGSVTDINLAGTVGSITRADGSNPPIQSYTAAPGSGVDTMSIATFVQNDLSGSLPQGETSDTLAIFSPNNPFFVLNDAVGNVGIVAGRAGFVQSGVPARDGVNGSVQNVTAGSIMSIVAGSVDDVAPVTLLSGITVTNPGGVFGADKSLLTSPAAGGANGQLDYYNSAGVPVSFFAAGDRLIDGILYAITIDQPAAGTPLIGPRIAALNDNG